MKPVILMAALSAVFLASARDISYTSDPFGYRPSATCAVNYLNIDAQATVLTLQAAGSDAASDEGAALLHLPMPYTYYNQQLNDVVISSNGYLAFAADLSVENGADFSNDCLFPSIPDNQPQSQTRIMPFHDDLQAGDNGRIQWAHFATCPYSANQTACTVIEWQNWRLISDPQAFSFQVILIYQPSSVVIQFDHRTPTPSSASVGFQNTGLFSGQILACNQPARQLAGTSHCFTNSYLFDIGFE